MLHSLVMQINSLPQSFTNPFTNPAAIFQPSVMQVQGLCFRYAERDLFTDFSLSLHAGVTLVQGGDGRGKSTLLRLLAGAQPAQAGHLQVNDLALKDQPAAYQAQVFWADPQSQAFEQSTPLDYFGSLPSLYPDFDDRALPELINGLSLKPHVEKPLYMLSTGSKRKVWLAAAFASKAAVTLLDEPFVSLDKISINFVLHLLKNAENHEKRAFVVTGYEAPTGIKLATMIDLGD